jgi:hypothetical protein
MILAMMSPNHTMSTFDVTDKSQIKSSPVKLRLFDSQSRRNDNRRFITFIPWTNAIMTQAKLNVAVSRALAAVIAVWKRFDLLAPPRLQP